MTELKLSPEPPQAAPTWEDDVERAITALQREVERLNHEHVKVASQVAQLMRERSSVGANSTPKGRRR
jgi:hypothetical protein